MRGFIDYIDYIKENKIFTGLVIGGGIFIVMLIFSILSNSQKVEDLKAQRSALNAELMKVEKNIAERQAVREQQKNDVVVESTGLDPKLVESDTELATEFFDKAFNWSSGDEYEQARQHYIKQLGEDNSFTKTYLPKDTVIDTNDGPLSFIDYHSLKATIDDVEIVALTAEDNYRVRYVAFVNYIMHRDEKDLANPDALEKSQAIVKFTVSGNPNENKRTVSEVEAWAGFANPRD